MSNQAPTIAVVNSLEYAEHDPEAPLFVDALREAGAHAYLHAWNATVDWAGYDLVVVRSPWDYFDHLDRFLRWVDDVAAATRIVNPAGVIRWNSHKGYLTEMGERGVPVLPTILLAGGSTDAAERLAACGWADVVVKPAVDGGARQTLRADPCSPEAAAHVERIVVAGDVVVQPYAPQIEAGETSLIYFGGVFSHAARKVPAAGDYRVQVHHGGTEHRHEPSPAELETARRAMACAPGPLTYARVDLVDVDGVPTLMELEVIEPDLFFRLADGALGRFADAVLAELPSASAARL
jgi:glutathione synthase/RimK-type ligase-like ATP-grasp enzyme